MKRRWSRRSGAGAGAGGGARNVARRTEAPRSGVADSSPRDDLGPLLDGFARDLGGTVQDVLTLARPVAALGFDLAAAGTGAPLRAVARALGVARGTSQRRGLSRLARLCRIGELAAKQVHRISQGVQQVVRTTALGSLDGADRSLSDAGAERLAVPRSVLGVEETLACVTIARTVARLGGRVGRSAAAARRSQVAAAVLALLWEQVAADVTGVATEADLPQLERSMWLCAAVYGPITNRAQGLFSQHGARDFLTSVAAARGYSVLMDGSESARPQMYRPAFAVFVDDADKAVVVAVRGTASMRDVLTDLVCEASALNEGELVVGSTPVAFVHTGMWRAAKALASELEAPVREALRERPGYRVLVVGHSLGGGVAALLCLLWRPLFGTQVTCLAYGSAAVLDIAAARAAASHGVTTVVFGDDIVPRLSLRSATEFAGKVFSHMPDELPAEASGAARRRASRPQEASPPLCPAGRLLVLSSVADGGPAPGSRVRVADQEAFTHLRLRPGMLSHHLPSAYVRALGRR